MTLDGDEWQLLDLEGGGELLIEGWNVEPLHVG